MTRRSLLFAAPRRIEIREDQVPEPGEGEVLVRTQVSAISAGTELHLYRGDIPEGVVLDENLPALSGRFQYPVSYGYSTVGEIDGTGRSVFGFHPHSSHFVARKDDLYDVPAGLDVPKAALWPTFETAVNLVLDGTPLVGERVLVVGQGMVGLAVTSILSRFPLERLWTVDPLERRRAASVRLGAERSCTPDELRGESGFDLTFELSGREEGLELGIAATGFEGRLVVGSWYGESPASIHLGMHFHRGRLNIQSSQVSHVGSRLRSRWSKDRRMQAARRALDESTGEELITHRFPIERAAEAFEQLDRHPEDCLQVLLTYT